ncbi:MAG: CNNM domain-containing protein [Planctomycetota bacterium]|nr:CNNM domain-containing protein [Planctomycetota bacterium]
MLAIANVLDPLLALPRDHPFSLLASAALLALSATFSSCETALFSLSPPERNRVRSGKGGSARILAALLDDLNRLLPTLLFCDMAVNMLVFAISASIGVEVGRRNGAGAAVAWSVLSLCVVIFFGEVFPKQAAIAARIPVARFTARPVWLCHRVLVKPLSLLHGLARVFERLADARRPDQARLREEELRLLMEFSKDDGVISDGEYALIDGIVNLSGIKIRDIMVPRVDAVVLKLDAGCEDALSLARFCRHAKLPVLDEHNDDFAGWVDAREIFVARAEGCIAGFLRRFSYFSEHDRADQALRAIKRRGDNIMAVVDERGAITGIFTRQDIMDEVLGDFGDHGAPPPGRIRERDGGYVVAGGVSVREWRELFAVSAAIPRSATVGGLVTSLLGRPAKRGDSVRLGNMRMTVLAVWRNRVTEVLLRLDPEDARTEPVSENAAGAGTPADGRDRGVR